MPAASHVEKDGHLHEHPAPAAVARQGARPAGRRRSRAVVHAPPLQARPGALRRLRGRARLADRQPHLGLRASTAPHRRARRRGGPAGDQRLRRGRRASPVPGFAAARRPTAAPPAAAGSTPASSQDGVNQARRRDAGRPRRPRRLGLARVGRGRGRRTAASSTTARRADPEGRPWSERKKLRLVGRGEGRLDRLRRPGLPGRQAAGLPRRPTTPQGWTRSAATTRSS